MKHTISTWLMHINYLCKNFNVQVFPKSSLLTSEFEKIRSYLFDRCVSNMGKEMVGEIAIINSFENIKELLHRTNEMRQILNSGLPFPQSGYTDVQKELNLLRIENSTLMESQFADIHSMMQTVKEVFQFFKNRKSEFPYLEFILSDSPYEKAIINEIELIIDENSVVRTNASVELSRIRKNLQRTRAEADRVYTTVINKYRKQGWLTGSEESSRNGRRVIAILAEQKRTIKGIIHDSSATGKTTFIEPEECIGVNNSIINLEQEERHEIIKILKALSAELRKFVPIMQSYRTKLGTFDLNLTKALLALDIDGKLPKLVNTPSIHLQDAKHPLLLLHNKKLNKPTVPFSLELNHENRILLISGPNAGGKTVCMKTAGLLQMMLQAGMLVSTHEDSVFGLFDHLMVDIGDSQSIEYELSTYSSRLRHMRIFMDRVNEKSLFLIDEFGTGTDPNLGGALAEAVLEELNNRKAIGIITTHYLNLKVFADRTKGISNGSMEFDLKKLQPLYRLVIGKPGSSYTFLVAERSGLPPAVIKNARRKVARKNLLLEKLLTEVQREKEEIKKLLADTTTNDKHLKEQIKNYEILTKSIEDKLSQKELKLKKLEERILRESEEKFRTFLKEWRKSKDKKEVFEKYYKQFVRKKKSENPEIIAIRKKEKLKLLRDIIKPGVLVRLQNGHTKGVVEQVDDEKAYVIFGNVKAVCEIINLEVVSE